MAMTGWVGVGESLTGEAPSTPAVAEDQANGPLANRLLFLERNRNVDVIGYRLVGREPGPVVRDLTQARTEPDALLAAAVQSTVNGSGVASAGSAHDSLANLGVGFVAFRGASTEPLVTRLDATAGLTRLSDSQGLILWRVLPRANSVSPSRLRLADARGAPVSSVAAGGDHARTDVSLGPSTPDVSAGGRRLVVAEPSRWAGHARVMFAGRELAAVAGAEQPTYPVPAHAGQLSITLPPTQPWWRWGQLGLLLIVLFLAVPSGSTRARTAS